MTLMLGTFTGATGVQSQLGYDGLLYDLAGVPFGALGADDRLYVQGTGRVWRDAAGQIKAFTGPAGTGTYTKAIPPKLEDLVRCVPSTMAEVSTIIYNQAGAPRNVFVLFNEIKLVEKNDLQRLIAEDFTNRFRYTPEWYDCEKFAFRLKGNFSIPPYAEMCFAFATGGNPYHAFNLAVCSDKKLYAIEPQTDQLIPWEQVTTRYKPLTLAIM